MLIFFPVILPTKYKSAKIVLNKINPLNATMNTRRYGVGSAISLRTPVSNVIPPEKARITAEKIVNAVIEEILLLSNLSSIPSSPFFALVTTGLILSISLFKS